MIIQAMPHSDSGRSEYIDLNIEFYGTGKLSPAYEKVLEEFFGTTDRKEMFKKALHSKKVPMRKTNGKIEVVNVIASRKDIEESLALFSIVQQRFAAVTTKWEAPKGNRRNWRRKKPNGEYEYRETPPGKSDKGKKPEQEKAKPKEYKHHRKISKEELKKTLSKGSFSIISAGRNSRDDKEKDMAEDDPFFHERHEDLRGMLEELGFPHTEVIGHYGGKESSFMVFHDGRRLTPKTSKSVMIHHSSPEESKKRKAALNELGKKFNQDSVLHGENGKNTVSFTSGKFAGKECGGEGWEERPKAKNLYTDMETEDGEHTKFAVNIDECFEKGYIACLRDFIDQRRMERERAIVAKIVSGTE